MCVILFIHIYISRNIYVFHVYIYTIIYTCVSTYYIHKRPMNFHSSLQMSFVLQYAPCCISMRKPDSAGCLIGWFQFHGAHDLINVRHCWIQNYFGWIHTPIENYYWRGDKAFEIIGQCFQRLCFWEFAEGLWPRPLDCPGCNRPRPKQKWPWKLRSWEFLHEERQIGT